jgi:hypothetical protein
MSCQGADVGHAQRKHDRCDTSTLERQNQVVSSNLAKMCLKKWMTIWNT